MDQNIQNFLNDILIRDNFSDEDVRREALKLLLENERDGITIGSGDYTVQISRENYERIFNIAVSEHRKIFAIKELRSITGLGLIHAKKVIEKIQEDNSIPFPR